MSHTQSVSSPTDQEVQPMAKAGCLAPPRPGAARSEAQQGRVTILMDLMSKLVEHMDTFSAIQIQNPHVPQTATQVKDILAVLLPEITTMGPLLLEHEQTKVMSMLHHVTQRVDAVWKAQVQTQTDAEAQPSRDAVGAKGPSRESVMKECEVQSKDDFIAVKKDIEVAALKARTVMRDTLLSCLAELNSDLRVEMKKKYM